MAREQEAAPVVGGSVNPMVMGSLAGRNNRMLAAQAEQRARIQGSQQIAVQREGIAAQRAMQSERIAADDRRQAAAIASEREGRAFSEQMMRLDAQLKQDAEASNRKWLMETAEKDRAERKQWWDETKVRQDRDTILNMRQSALRLKAVMGAMGKMFGQETAAQKQLQAIEESSRKAETERQLFNTLGEQARTQMGAVDLKMPLSVLMGQGAAVETLGPEMVMTNFVTDSLLQRMNVSGGLTTALDDPTALAESAKGWSFQDYAAVRTSLEALRERLDAEEGEMPDKMLKIVEKRIANLEALGLSSRPLEDGTGTLGSRIGGFRNTIKGVTEAELARRARQVSPNDPKAWMSLFDSILDANNDPNDWVGQESMFDPKAVEEANKAWGPIYDSFLVGPKAFRDAAAPQQ